MAPKSLPVSREKREGRREKGEGRREKGAFFGSDILPSPSALHPQPLPLAVMQQSAVYFKGMRETNTAHFVGVDVGTSAVRVVVGTVDVTGRPEIIGFSSAENTGMRRGVVSHADEVASAITMALQDAERVSGRHILSATININGSHVQGFNSRGVIAISAANREITIDDRMRVEEAAAVMQLPANREIIQVFPNRPREAPAPTDPLTVMPAATTKGV